MILKTDQLKRFLTRLNLESACGKKITAHDSDQSFQRY